MGGLTLGIKENHGWWPNILSGPWTSKYTWYIIIYPGFILDQTFEIRLPNNEQIQIDMLKWSRDRNRYAQDVGYWNAARIQCTVRNPKTLVAFDATFCCQMRSIFGLFFWISWASWTFYFAESLWQRHSLTPIKLPTFQQNLGTLYPRYPYNDCHTVSHPKGDAWPLLLKRPRFFSTLLNVFVFSNDELRDPAELVKYPSKVLNVESSGGFWKKRLKQFNLGREFLRILRRAWGFELPVVAGPGQGGEVSTSGGAGAQDWPGQGRLMIHWFIVFFYDSWLMTHIPVLSCIYDSLNFPFGIRSWR